MKIKKLNVCTDEIDALRSEGLRVYEIVRSSEWRFWGIFPGSGF